MSKTPWPWEGRTVRLPRHFFRSRLPVWVCLLVVLAAAAPAAGEDPSGKPAPAAVSPAGTGERITQGTSPKQTDADTQLAGIDEDEPRPEPTPKKGARKTWFQAWKDIKKDLKDKTGTDVSVYLDQHVGFVLSGPGKGHERDLFWWQVNVKQRLWKDARFIFKVRGSSHSDNPPSGVVPLVGSNINLDWMAYETGWASSSTLTSNRSSSTTRSWSPSAR